MNPYVIVLSITVFTAFLLLQIAARRAHRPPSEDIYLLKHWLAGPIPVFGLLLVFDGFGFSKTEIGLSYLLFFTIASSWIASYPAIYAASPTLIMAWIIRANALGGGGTSYEELCETLNLKANSTDRIGDAEREGLIRVDDGKVSPTQFGRNLARFFRLYRKFLGLRPETA